MNRISRYGAIAAFLAAVVGLTGSQPLLRLGNERVPTVRHVFVIVLENASYDRSYGSDADYPYLAGTVRGQGVLLSQYYATSHYSLGNYLAILGGVAPNTDTQKDCPYHLGMNNAAPAPLGQVSAPTGCIYPSWVPSLAGQLSAKNLSWRGYLEDMGNVPGREQTSCGKPSLGRYSADMTQKAVAGDAYAARHNPFLYFSSIVDTPACAANVGPLSRLPQDLASVPTTPNFSFISPSLCNDGHDQNCDGQPAGPAAEDAWLRTWVQLITSSPAFRKDGALFIVTDESDGDSSACCREPSGPNVASPGVPKTADQSFAGGVGDGMGGGLTGAVVISPFVRPGSTSAVPYNHYSLLRSIEDLFALPHLGYAGMPGLRGFGRDIWSAPAPGTPRQ